LRHAADESAAAVRNWRSLCATSARPSAGLLGFVQTGSLAALPDARIHAEARVRSSRRWRFNSWHNASRRRSPGPSSSASSRAAVQLTPIRSPRLQQRRCGSDRQHRQRGCLCSNAQACLNVTTTTARPVIAGALIGPRRESTDGVRGDGPRHGSRSNRRPATSSRARILTSTSRYRRSSRAIHTMPSAPVLRRGLSR